MSAARPVHGRFRAIQLIPVRSIGRSDTASLAAAYVTGLDPAVQSFLAAAFCATALVCLTSAGILAVHILDRLSDGLARS
jgi:hypothetical protein